MSNNTVLAALRTMGYDGDEMTGHGFRAMARTILDEICGKNLWVDAGWKLTPREPDR